jgi:hypothetical protein
VPALEASALALTFCFWPTAGFAKVFAKVRISLILQLYFTVLSCAAASGTSLQWLGDAAARATNQ